MVARGATLSLFWANLEIRKMPPDLIESCWMCMASRDFPTPVSEDDEFEWWEKACYLIWRRPPTTSPHLPGSPLMITPLQSTHYCCIDTMVGCYTISPTFVSPLLFHRVYHKAPTKAWGWSQYCTENVLDPAPCDVNRVIHPALLCRHNPLLGHLDHNPVNSQWGYAMDKAGQDSQDARCIWNIHHVNAVMIVLDCTSSNLLVAALAWIFINWAIPQIEGIHCQRDRVVSWAKQPNWFFPGE